MFLENISSSNQVTMNSQEIADLVQSRHDKVKQSIERLASRGVIELPPMGEIKTATRPASVYVFSGEKGKRDSLIVVAQLCPEFTGAIVDRWIELEGKAIPKTLPEALRLAADLAERVEQQQAQLAIAEPKAKALDVIDSSEGALNIRDTGKTLGIGQKKFIEWALKNEWLYRDSKNKLQAYSKRIQQGYLEIKATTYGHASFGSRATTQTVVTPQGLVQLSKVFSSIGKE